MVAQPEAYASSDQSLSPKIPNMSPSFNGGVDPFTEFSWESFVALNWPAEDDGKPSEKTIGQYPDAPRVWEFYKTPEEVFLPGGVSPAENLQLLEKSALPKECPADVGRAYGTDRVLSMISKADTKELPNVSPEILQATGQPLVDQKFHYVIYEIRLNPDEVGQIDTNGWNKLETLEQYKDHEFEFKPNKAAPNLREPGPIELKLSWLLLDDSYTPEQKSQFYTTTRAIYVPSQQSSTGKAFCQPVTLGLLGFHLAHKLPAPNPSPSENPIPLWVWSTFSQVKAETYLSNPSCSENCETNKLYAKAPYLWNPTNLQAVQKNGEPQIPTQVKALSPAIPSKANEIPQGNQVWQERLSEAANKSVWQNYQLIGTQWPTNPWPDGGSYSNQSPTPGTLADLSIETYNQEKSSCIACHTGAKLPPKGNLATSDFSFMFQKAD